MAAAALAASQVLKDKMNEAQRAVETEAALARRLEVGASLLVLMMRLDLPLAGLTALFGVPVPEYMDGQALLVGDSPTSGAGAENGAAVERT